MDNTSMLSTAPGWEGEDELVPSGPDVGMTINAVLKIIFYVTVMVLGVSGNALILGVYWSKPSKTGTHVLIMSLAWVDLVVCLVRVYNVARFISILIGKESPGFFLYIAIFGAVSVFMSIVLTGAIAFERYDCVCRPGRRLLNKRRAKLMVLGSCVPSFVVVIPLTLNQFAPSPTFAKMSLTFQLILYLAALLMIVICYWKVYEAIRKHVKVHVLGRHGAGSERSTGGDSTRGGAIPPPANGMNLSVTLPLSKNEQPVQMQHSIGIRIVTPAEPRPSTHANRREVPTILSPAASPQPNLGTPALQDHDSRTSGPNRRLRTADPQPRENPTGTTMTLQRKTTRMLFVTSVVFLVTWFPYWLYVVVSLHKHSGGNIHENVLVIMYNCTLFVYVNNVVNPLIYGLSNRRFRKDCLDVLRKLTKLC